MPSSTFPLLPFLTFTSLAAWSLLGWALLWPWLVRRSKREALMVAVAPHMFRHVGAMALLPGLADVPRGWALALAWGDGATALLAMASVIALHRDWRHATKLVWAFSLFGLGDMLHNGFEAAVQRVAPHLGVISYVVAFIVPGMLVFHVLVLRTLWRPSAPGG